MIFFPRVSSKIYLILMIFIGCSIQNSLNNPEDLKLKLYFEQVLR